MRPIFGTPVTGSGGAGAEHDPGEMPMTPHADRPPSRTEAAGASPEEGDEYLLGTATKELERLGFQHQVWAEPTARVWEHAGFGPGDTLLDLGCGPGYASLDLAQRVGPRGHVVAADISERFLHHLRTQCAARGIHNVEPLRIDVRTLDLAGRRFDGAFARWVLCYLEDPEAVVREVARTLRPGGSFAVVDYCHYLAFTVAPRTEAIERVIRATDASIRAAGGNPDVGRDLPGIMERCGLRVRHLAPLVRVARPGSALWQWPETFFATYLDTLVGMGLLREEEGAAFRTEWRRLSADSAAFLFTPTMIELVAVRA
jgi:SAM-dependent methyltransferase